MERSFISLIKGMQYKDFIPADSLFDLFKAYGMECEFHFLPQFRVQNSPLVNFHTFSSLFKVAFIHRQRRCNFVLPTFEIIWHCDALST